MSKDRADSDFIFLIDQHGLLSDIEDYIADLESVYFVTSSVSRSAYKLLKKIHSTIGFTVNDVFVFNDKSWQTWALMLFLKRKRVLYIEDGSSAYTTSRVVAVGLKKILLQVLSCLPLSPYQYIEVLGTSKLISGGYYLFPKLVRREHTLLPVYQYELCVTRKLKLKNLFSIALDQMIPENGAVLSLLPSVSAPVYSDFVDFTMDIGLKNEMPIFVKMHPLSEGTYVVSEFYEVPKSLPAEAILITGRVSILVGNYTTSLYSSQFLFEGIRSINFCGEGTLPCYENLGSFFNKVGVEQVFGEKN